MIDTIIIVLIELGLIVETMVVGCRVGVIETTIIMFTKLGAMVESVVVGINMGVIEITIIVDVSFETEVAFPTIRVVNDVDDLMSVVS